MAGILCYFKSSHSTLVKNSAVIHGISSEGFFNRSKEMDLLFTGIIEGNPNFNIITGPVNSGKSMLLSVLTKTPVAQHIPVLTINLHSISFNSMDTLVSILEKEGSSWMKQFRNAVKHFQLDAIGYSFQLSRIPKVESLIIRLNNLLHLFEVKLPSHTFWHGARAPVVMVDKVNELAALTTDDTGDKALHNFFKWLVLNTKERSRFHASYQAVTVFSSLGILQVCWIHLI